jgi:hypothetical protein
MRELLFVAQEVQQCGYIAKAIGASIVTEADTIDELKMMIKDAIQCHYDSEMERPEMIRLRVGSEEWFI